MHALCTSVLEHAKAKSGRNSAGFCGKGIVVMADQQKKVKGVVDIVFLLDITGSMGHCIEAMKNNISAFVDYLTTKNANNQSPVKHWRAKIVGYRDFEEDAIPFFDNPFVEDAAQLKTQLGKLEADGGGDIPESLLDALYKVCLLYTSPSPRDRQKSRMPSSA